MIDLDKSEKEELRHICLGVLVVRHPNALTAMAVRNRAAMETSFTINLAHVEAALAFLENLKLVEEAADGLGSTGYFKATAPGVLEHERSKRP